MSEPGGTTTTLDWAAVISGATGALVVIGAGIKWLFGRADRRETRQQKREDAYVEKIEARLKLLEETTGDLWTCFHLVANALHEKDPMNKALRRAADILGDAFPIDLATPPDMIAALDKLS